MPPVTEPPVILPASVPASPTTSATPAAGVRRPSSVPRATAPAARFRWRHELLRLALALPLIVVGVVVAQLAMQQQEQRERTHRATQLRAELRREVIAVGAGAAGVHRLLGAALARMDDAARTGSPPPRQPMPGAEAIRAHMWQTAVQSGAIELLDMATVWRLSEFYSQLAIGTQQLQRLDDPSARASVTAVGVPLGDPRLRTDELQPRGEGYAATVGEAYETTGRIAVQADSLALLLAPPGRR